MDKDTYSEKIADAVRRMDLDDGSDPERAHGLVDDVLVDFAPHEVQQAVRRLMERAKWWASA